MPLVDLEVVVGWAGRALHLVVLLSAPLVLAAAAVGLVVGVLQAVTRIHEPTVSFAPKVVAAVLTVVFLAPWMARQLVEFATDLWQLVPALGSS